MMIAKYSLEDLPNFFIIGATKCGTTSLYHCLKHHPEIFFSREKEPHFFDNDTNYAHGLKSYIEHHFSGASSYPIRAEATPWYLYKWRKVIPRMQKIYEHTPPRFVVLLRDPVERAWSHYLHMVRNMVEVLPFSEALALEESRLNEDETKWYGYYSEGLYSEQLKAWFAAFGRECFRVYLTDDLATDPEAVIRDVQPFLGVSDYTDRLAMPFKNTVSVPLSKTLMHFMSSPPKWLYNMAEKLVSKETRRKTIRIIRRINLKRIDGKQKSLSQKEAFQLYKCYEPYILHLEKTLDRDLTAWKTRHYVDKV
jgi:hypothetical protein